MRLKAFLAFAIACISTAWGQGTTKIGVITSITGSLAAFGEAHKNGYAIALDEINANGAPKTIAIVYENTNFGQSNMKAMQAAAKEAGMNVVAVESYEAKSPDYKAVLQRVKQANPDVIYYCSYLLDATTLMRQTREVDLNPRYYASAGTGFAAAEFPTDKGAGKNAEYTFSVSQWLPSAKWVGSKEFD